MALGRTGRSACTQPPGPFGLMGLRVLTLARAGGQPGQGQQAAGDGDQGGAGPDDDRPRIAAVARAAILIELTDIPPGDRRDQAMAVATRFLDAGIATLRPASG